MAFPVVIIAFPIEYLMPQSVEYDDLIIWIGLQTYDLEHIIQPIGNQPLTSTSLFLRCPTDSTYLKRLMNPPCCESLRHLLDHPTFES